MKKAFIEIVDPKDAEGKLKRVYRRIGGSRGRIANVHQCQSLHPKAMMAHLELYMSIMYEDSPLTRVQRELLGTIVSYLNNCNYCVVHHWEALRHHWSDVPSVDALLDGDQLSTQDKELLEFAKKLTNSPGSIEERDVDKLRSVGFGDRAVLDISLIIGYFNFVNRLVMGVGVKLEKQEDRDYKY